MSTDPASNHYNQPITVQGATQGPDGADLNVANSPLGISGMAIGPDGNTLVLGVPMNRNSVTLSKASERGNVLVLDLSNFDPATGKGAVWTRVTMSDALAGKSPQTVTATRDPDHFLVSNIADYNQGLATLVITRDPQGQVLSAEMKPIDLSQPQSALRADRLDIQRTQSAVLVTVNGIEYAIVADDNYNFLDPYWQVMTAPPDGFLFSPGGGPPTAYGGGASARHVNVGGKLGIVKDPFGDNPEYLGATLPLDGYGIDNLSVSEDGKVLLGQLKGLYSTTDPMNQQPNGNAAWSVAALIAAATDPTHLANRLSEHITLADNAQQKVSAPGQGGTPLTAPVGTVFDPDTITVNAVGNMGDVIAVDWKDLAARKLLRDSTASDHVAFTDAQMTAPLATLPQELQDKITARMRALSDFQLQVTGKELQQLIDNTDVTSLRLVGVKKSDGTLVVFSPGDTIAPADIAGAVTLYFVPNITQTDEATLRSGATLQDKSKLLSFTYKDTGRPGIPGAGTVTVTAKDYAQASSLFFGDRNLDNPGYSDFAATWSEAFKQAVLAYIDTNAGKNGTPPTDNAVALAVWQIEQRLRYLGFGPSALPGQQNAEITVDGKLNQAEKADLRQFDQIVNEQTDYTAKNVPYFQSGDFQWLNAYNAPHWMVIKPGVVTVNGQRIDPLSGWVNKTTDPMQNMGVSWVYDLMLASAQNDNPLIEAPRQNPLWFAGTNDLGNRLNLGINTAYVSQKANGSGNQDVVNQKDIVLGLLPNAGLVGSPNLDMPNPVAYLYDQWSLSNASVLASLLHNPTVAPKPGHADQNAQGKNLQDQALLDFLTLYGTTQKDGYWGNINLQGKGDADTIRTALFGSGDKISGGLIDSSHVLLGSTADTLGDAMTAASLQDLMGGGRAGVNYNDWLRPLQQAMAAFDFTTPQRITEFLAQIEYESGQLSADVESMVYKTPAQALAMFPSKFSSTQDVIDYYNNTLFADHPDGWYEDAKHWTPDIQRQFADYVYNGALGNTVGPDDGWNFRGRGPIQLTGRTQYEEFGDYLDSLPRAADGTVASGVLQGLKLPTGAQILDDPDLYFSGEGNRPVQALSAAWWWHKNVGIAGSDAVDWNNTTPPVVTKTVDSKGVAHYHYEGGNPFTDFTSLKVNHYATNTFVGRWNNWNVAVHGVTDGGNPYDAMRAVLTKLGIDTIGTDGYQRKIGIMVHPQRQAIVGDGNHNLVAQAGTPSAVSTPGGAQSLTFTANLDSSTIGGDMFVHAQPPAPPAIVAKAPAKHAVGVCDVVDTDPHSKQQTYSLGASAFASAFFPKLDIEKMQIEVVSKPKHGTLHIPPKRPGQPYPARNMDFARYQPDAGYTGFDKFSVRVTDGHYDITIYYSVQVYDVLPSPDAANSDPWCHSTAIWKISAISRDGIPIAQIDPTGVLVSYADLPGSSIGQERNDGKATSITLDTNAAGYGWFVDFTPADNVEFLPTANTSEWIAKPGSAAAGKMDLYSVLLHEYGHALGLDHSPDSHDFMAASLQPGVRHLLSESDLQTIAKMAGVPAPDPNAPLPPIPFDLSLMALAFMRKESATADNGPDGSGGPNGPGGPDPDAAGATEVHYDVVVNPELTNPEFNGTTGWNTEGQVTTSDGAATLSESTASQTRLNQLFVVGPNDKTLRFTITKSLDNPDNGPEDAFEAALLDANTGESLLDPIDLSRSDAILNLQGDGSAFLSDKVQVIANGDGSHTYVVDLNGIAAGTAVNLSFDLLGFGKLQSQVTIRGLHIGAGEEQPVTQADTVTTAEDTPFSLDARVNDTNANLPGYVPVIVDAPAHGQVTVNSDGTFAYTPDANYNGADSFTYKLSNGSVDSNVSTVDITITPVNDAPVTGNLSPTTLEDVPANINLVSQAHDIDSPTLTPRIVEAPAHGQLALNTDGTWSYTPNANFNGADSFTYVVNDGELDSNIATAIIAVTSVNDAPTGTGATVTTLEDTPYIFKVSDFGFSDPDDTPANAFTAVIISGLPAAGNLTLDGNVVTAGQRITVADIAAGKLQFLAAPNANGQAYASISFQVQDDGGTANGGVDTDPVARALTINVTPVNDPPVAAATHVTGVEDTPYVFAWSDFGFSDPDDTPANAFAAIIISGLPAAGSLTLEGQAVTTGQRITVADIAAGKLQFVAAPNANGQAYASITFQVQDDGGTANGGVDTDPTARAITINVTPVNDPPVAAATHVTGVEDTPYVFAWSDFAVSDIDSTALSIVLASLPADGAFQVYGGTAWAAATVGEIVSTGEITAGHLRFVPAPNASGGSGFGGTGTGNRQPHYAQFDYRGYDGELLSAAASVVVDITPVADAPTLTLTDRAGGTREIFRTDWEDVANYDRSSTLVWREHLDGWTLVRHPDSTWGGWDGFEVWSDGDRMEPPQGKPVTVHAAQDGGQNWLELNDARGLNHQTLGIEREINTVAGATYTLNFDYAGRIGYSQDYTAIGIYIDGKEIAHYAGTSPKDALNWQALSFSFMGQGGKQTLRIVSEATKHDPDGRGAMLDNLVLTQSQPANTRLEDTAIPLSSIRAALTDSDGSEALSLAIKGLPVGAILSDGGHYFTATASTRTADISGWALNRLTLLPPKDFNGTITLSVDAASTETANGTVAHTMAKLTVTVLPVNDAPVAKPDQVSVREHKEIRINVLANDTDIDSTKLSADLVCGPSRATLTERRWHVQLYR